MHWWTTVSFVQLGGSSWLRRSLSVWLVSYWQIQGNSRGLPSERCLPPLQSMGKYHLWFWKQKSFFSHHNNKSVVTTYFKIPLNSSFFSLRQTWLALTLFYLPLPFAIPSSFVAFQFFKLLGDPTFISRFNPLLTVIPSSFLAFKSAQRFSHKIYRHTHTPTICYRRT